MGGRPPTISGPRSPEPPSSTDRSKRISWCACALLRFRKGEGSEFMWARRREPRGPSTGSDSRSKASGTRSGRCGREPRGLGTTGEEVRVSVPGDALGAEAGDRLTDVRAFTAVGESATGGLVVLDELSLPDATVPAHSVALGIAPRARLRSRSHSTPTPRWPTAASPGPSTSRPFRVATISSGRRLAWATRARPDRCRRRSRIRSRPGAWGSLTSLSPVGMDRASERGKHVAGRAHRHSRPVSRRHAIPGKRS